MVEAENRKRSRGGWQRLSSDSMTGHLDPCMLTECLLNSRRFPDRKQKLSVVDLLAVLTEVESCLVDGFPNTQKVSDVQFYTFEILQFVLFGKVP